MPDQINYSDDSSSGHRQSFGLILFLFISALVVLIAIVGWVFSDLASAAFSKPALSANPLTIKVTPGETWQQLGSSLAAQSEIPSAFWLRFYIKIHPAESYLSAGTYVLPGRSNIRQIVLQLHTITAIETPLRIPEGATVNDIATAIANDSALNISKADVITAEQQLVSTYDFLGEPEPQTKSLEGYLFPDTYDEDSNATAGSILQQMLNNENIKLSLSMRAAIKANNMSIAQTIIIASLIEKEIGTTGTTVRDPNVVQQERQTVAGIIENRLKIGMPLQLDSTKDYLPPDQTQPDFSYDTYANAGLPPGPICNPSLDSIQAVINPISSNYLYFITDKTGAAHFAATIEQQDANIAQYLDK